jgi:tRNA threonylcarbamoyladenosine biosynthesis protein TsaE
VDTFISNSAAETEAFGLRFADQVNAGSVLALQGDLGAGKTHFTKGLVTGLGSGAAVTSPTFTIINEYLGGQFPIYHFDFFRLEDEKRLTVIGLDDYFFGDGVCVVEWADRFERLIPEQARWIQFQIQSDHVRVVNF